MLPDKKEHSTSHKLTTPPYNLQNLLFRKEKNRKWQHFREFTGIEPSNGYNTCGLVPYMIRNYIPLASLILGSSIMNVICYTVAV